MNGVWDLQETWLYSQNLPLLKQQSHIQEKQKLWTKCPEWNNVTYEVKREKSYYFTDPAQDTTNSHPNFNQKKRMETWEKKAHTGSKKKQKKGKE